MHRESLEVSVVTGSSKLAKEKLITLLSQMILRSETARDVHPVRSALGRQEDAPSCVR
jgi:hypothetical protein